MRKHNSTYGDARTAYETALGCWNATSSFRADRKRNKRYTFGNQWTDKIVVDGCEIREFGIKESLKKLNRQLEKVADSFGHINDI